MKKKLVIALAATLALSFSLTACGKSADNETSSSDSSISSSSDSSFTADDGSVFHETTAPESDYVVEEVESETVYEDGRSKAVLTAYDYEGNIVWTITTESAPATELTSAGGLCLYEDRYFYYESGKIKAVARDTAEPIWENTDFIGASASGTTDNEGNLYVSGYYGPMLMGIDKDGKTLFVKDELEGANAQWPHDLYYNPESNSISMGVALLPDLDDGILTVSLSDFSCTTE